MMAAWILFAEPSVSDYATPVSAILSVGFATWLAWFLITKAMPKRDKLFADAIQAQRAEFLKSIDGRDEHWRRDSQNSRTEFLGSLESSETKYEALLREERRLLEQERDRSREDSAIRNTAMVDIVSKTTESSLKVAAALEEFRKALELKGRICQAFAPVESDKA